jgi:hypothetical protein
MAKSNQRKRAQGKFARQRRCNNGARDTLSQHNMRVVAPPMDFIEARKEISRQVREASIGIVDRLIELAEEGELAPAKYLFEMVGLYPAMEEAKSKPENSLAYTLLKRMGLPTEAPIDEEEPVRQEESKFTNGKV